LAGFVVGSVANSENGVIVEVDGALFVGNNATLVVVEGVTSSINTNSDRCSLEGSFQGTRAGEDGVHSSGMDPTLGLIIVTLAGVLGMIRVVSFGLKRSTHG